MKTQKVLIGAGFPRPNVVKEIEVQVEDETKQILDLYSGDVMIVLNDRAGAIGAPTRVVSNVYGFTMQADEGNVRVAIQETLGIVMERASGNMTERNFYGPRSYQTRVVDGERVCVFGENGNAYYNTILQSVVLSTKDGKIRPSDRRAATMYWSRIADAMVDLTDAVEGSADAVIEGDDDGSDEAGEAVVE